MIRLALLLVLWTGTALAQSSDPVQAYIDMRAAAIAHGTAEFNAHNSGWGMTDAESFDVDLAGGTITWTFAEGHQARASAQLIGTWYDNTFLWGWAHPSAPTGTATAAEAVRQWGVANGARSLITEQPVTDLAGAGEFAMMASFLGDVQGVYSAQVRPGTYVYVGFGEVTLGRADK